MDVDGFTIRSVLSDSVEIISFKICLSWFCRNLPSLLPSFLPSWIIETNLNKPSKKKAAVRGNSSLSGNRYEINTSFLLCFSLSLLLSSFLPGVDLHNNSCQKNINVCSPSLLDNLATLFLRETSHLQVQNTCPCSGPSLFGRVVFPASLGGCKWPKNFTNSKAAIVICMYIIIIYIIMYIYSIHIR